MNMDNGYATFSKLLDQLLKESQEGNRCWAKYSRISDSSSDKEDYAEYGQIADQKRANIRSLLLEGKYIFESKEAEMLAIKKVKQQMENYSWELDFTPSDDSRKHISKEEKELAEDLENLKTRIENGQQAKIKKSRERESKIRTYRL